MELKAEQFWSQLREVERRKGKLVVELMLAAMAAGKSYLPAFIAANEGAELRKGTGCEHGMGRSSSHRICRVRRESTGAALAGLGGYRFCCGCRKESPDAWPKLVRRAGLLREEKRFAAQGLSGCVGAG